MKNSMRFLCLIIILTFFIPQVFAEDEVKIDAKSYILMDKDTGNVMYENNPDEQLPIASVTKVMTMLLAMEALQSAKITMDDTVTCSEYAASMGGSQIYLEPGEEMGMRDILKSIAVASGNDAATALAEHIMGSETAFVNAMNERAKSLGMNNTHFMNCTGLDEEGHYSCARDVAIMSRELIMHDEILEFTGIWMDTIRNGEFGLSNTNKLIRFYPGAIGIKTGSTSVAKYCLSAAAKRDNLTLIAVVIGAETTKERFEGAKRLLDYGFANYSVSNTVAEGESFGPVTVYKGKDSQTEAIAKNGFSFLTSKNQADKTEKETILYENIKAPVEKGQKIGEVIITSDGEEKGRVDLIAKYPVGKVSVIYNVRKLIKKWVMK